MKKTLFALLLMLALLLALPALAQEPAAEAQDITDLCTFTPSNAKSDLPKMRDGKYKTYWSSTKKGYLEISSPDDTPMYGLYINWAQYITNWSLQVPDENGGWTTIRAYEPDLFNTVYNEYLPLEGGFTYGDLESDAYKKLTPCVYCAAPARLATLYERYRAAAEQIGAEITDEAKAAFGVQ